MGGIGFVAYAFLNADTGFINNTVMKSLGREGIAWYTFPKAWPFGLFYQIPQNSGALFGVTQTIDIYVYRGLMELNNVGMSAAGFYQSIVGLVLVLAANALVRKLDADNALF